MQVLDGFRHDYLSKFSTPNLDRISGNGIVIPQVEPEFPASRDPWLVSLLTGHHTEDHGIFAQHIFSKEAQKTQDIDQSSELWAAARNLSTLWVRFVYFYLLAHQHL